MGGFYSGEVTEILGRTEAGKSWFLSAFCKHCLQTAVAVWIVDSNHSYSKGEIQQLPSDRLQLLRHAVITDPLALLSLFQCILKEKEKPNSLSHRVIVIDSLASILAPVISLPSSKASPILHSVRQCLAQLAQQHVAVLCVNHLLSYNGEVRSALGEAFQSACSLRIRIDRLQHSSGENTEIDPPRISHRLTVLKSTRVAYGTNCIYASYTQQW